MRTGVEAVMWRPPKLQLLAGLVVGLTVWAVILAMSIDLGRVVTMW